MTTFTLITYSRVSNLNPLKAYNASVHVAGCGAIGKDVQDHGGVCEQVVSETARGVVAKWLGSDEEDGTPASLGYTAGNIKVCNCAR